MTVELKEGYMPIQYIYMGKRLRITIFCKHDITLKSNWRLQPEKWRYLQTWQPQYASTCLYRPIYFRLCSSDLLQTQAIWAIPKTVWHYICSPKPINVVPLREWMSIYIAHNSAQKDKIPRCMKESLHVISLPAQFDLPLNLRWTFLSVCM